MALVVVIAIAAISASTSSTNDAATVARPSSEGTTPDEPADPQPDPAPSSGGAQRPVDLGNDPYFDGLAESCFEGTLTDCDLLYRQSEVGSDYEAYGATCGGRDLDADTPGACDPTQPPYDVEPEPNVPQTPSPQVPAPQSPATQYQEPLYYCHYYDSITGAGFNWPAAITEAECYALPGGTIVGPAMESP